MNPADTLGWTAAALMVATFSCRDPMWMRPLAVCTNLAFIGYACNASLAPVLALHALLLPINVLRWWQCGRQVNVLHPGRSAFSRPEPRPNSAHVINGAPPSGAARHSQGDSLRQESRRTS
jgi:hypothetical protein